MDLIKSVTSIIDTVKKLKEINDKIKDADLKNVIADLNLELSEIKVKLSEMINENNELKEKIRIIEDTKNQKEELILKNDSYYTKNGDGPFCTGCFDKSGKKIRLIKNPIIAAQDFGKYKCPVCGNFFR
ncbi:MAG: hypothetical protein JXB50_12100 [Spirochaetes bacterium]|nr:hypothetical protein [Spirochaetota bacterium]